MDITGRRVSGKSRQYSNCISGVDFDQVGVREKLGQMAGVWRDVVLLERRSKVAGVN